MKTNLITVSLCLGLSVLSYKSVIAQDDLGNHIATQNLNMSSYGIDSASFLNVLNPSTTSGGAVRISALNGQIRLFDTEDIPSTKFTQIERNGDAFHIYQNNGSSYQHVLSAKMNGNVGLGTPNPASLLDIKNTSTTSGGAVRISALNGQIRLFDTEDVPSTKFTQIERNGDAFHIYQNNGSTYQHVLSAKMNGNVGIGTANPQSKLHVSNGVLQIDGNSPESWTTSNWKTRLKSPISSAWLTTVPSSENNRYMGIGMTNSGWYFIQSDNPSGSTSSSACYPFYVTQYGKVVTREVQVTLNGWCDYVFDDDYELKGLSQVKSFIKENKHLPDVPSEKEVLENGVNLGDMDAILLKKIEELMLYTIQQEEKIEKQQMQIDQLLEKYDK